MNHHPSATLGLLRQIHRAWHLRNITWGKLLARCRIPVTDVYLEDHGKRLRLTPLNTSLTLSEAEYLLPAYPLLRDLATKVAATFSRGSRGDLIIQVGGVHAYLRGTEEVLILHEIYVLGIYHFELPGSVVVWDVGMNVGLSALYFASMNSVIVEGFEPVPELYQQALQNIALNPELAPRITPHATGIGDKTESVVGRVYLNRHGSSGCFASTQHRVTGETSRPVSLPLESAVSVFDQLCARHPDRSILVKLDCEGPEYVILPALKQQERLRQVTGILMEWHRLTNAQDPSQLIHLLTQDGYIVFRHGAPTDSAGMMYAVRHENRQICRPDHAAA